MKLIIIFTFICTLCLVGTGNAQPYQSIFGESTTEWKMVINGAAGPMTTYTEDILIGVQKDTVFHGKNYKKIQLNIGPRSDTYYSTGLLREDVSTGKVWYCEYNQNYCGQYDTVEKLAY